MISNEGKNFLDKSEKVCTRFTKKELLEQKKSLIVYIIDRLTTPDVDSIKESIQDISALTGFELSLEEAIQLKGSRV